ncbi:glucosamine-6-phosphate deaminase [uncultured Dubosiella sp.]|uniref:glucosamine-6-phosphate deaminase n=1 Tax=uncultured Dubosiella sp. TaxID=1937011 RepID=UPI002082CF43|nr:glucosamine-6-phosphate deaminase [uncultured Dubosiella sp.]GJM58349.1 glucosamine-6-phosphate deaminase [Erysipelotrichaceae bacterium OPF54]
MKIAVCENYDELSNKAFEVIKEQVVEKPDSVLGLATGSSPVGMYKDMIKDHKENGTSYKDVVTYNLDEYVGIDRNDPQSYYTFMNENLFSEIDIDPKNTHVPYGNTKEDCEKYEDSVNGVDIQVLGIGQNGHIGFNEPGTPFDEPTHIVDLTENTREANARFFDNDIDKVPAQAITQGIGTIMKAKKILLVANGANKADAVKAMIEGPVSVECPASVLQNHPDVVVVIDKEAASKLSK